MTAMLDGTKVVLFGEHLPGQYAAMVLRDLGAEVILVEPPGGVAARVFPDLFGSVAGGYRSVALDLKTEHGQRAARQVIATADVVIEGYRPEKMDKLGLGPQTLRAAHPSLVYVSLSGYGQSGPYRDRPGHELSYQGVAGLLGLGGPDPDPDPDPDARADGWATPVPVGDYLSGAYAVVAVLCGLLRRNADGQGTHADVSMTDCLVSMLTPQLHAALNGGALPPIPPDDPVHGVFTTSDGERITISIAFEDHFFASLCHALGLAGLAGLRTDERRARPGAVRDRLADAIRLRTLTEMHALLEEAGVPWGAVNSLADLAEEPHVLARGMIRSATGEDGDRSRYVSQPVRFEGHTRGHRGLPPVLGEHTDIVLKDAGVPAEDRTRIVGA